MELLNLPLRSPEFHFVFSKYLYMRSVDLIIFTAHLGLIVQLILELYVTIYR